MNPEIKEKWVAALRSGEYQQGRVSLRDDQGRYCCLGVLCELAVQEGVIPPPRLDFEEGRYAYAYAQAGGGEMISGLPIDVQDWADYNSALGRLPSYVHDKGWLVDLNDDTDLGFEVIADIIEEYL